MGSHKMEETLGGLCIKTRVYLFIVDY